MKFLLQLFTWWNGQTLGTRFYTWRKGVAVGSDEFNNIYYRDRGDAHRWVVYDRLAEPSLVPPGWHGWLHHTADAPPDDDYQAKPWQKPHRPNMTGSPQAYRPDGSLLAPGGETRDYKDYEAWKP